MVDTFSEGLAKPSLPIRSLCVLHEGVDKRITILSLGCFLIETVEFSPLQMDDEG